MSDRLGTVGLLSYVGKHRSLQKGRGESLCLSFVDSLELVDVIIAIDGNAFILVALQVEKSRRRRSFRVHVRQEFEMIPEARSVQIVFLNLVSMNST